LRPCGAQIRQQREIDARLREIVMAEDPNSAALAQKIRRQIAAESPARNRSLLLAAGLSAVLLAAGFVYRALGPAPRMYADAARDHHREVVDRQHRVWFSDPAAIQSLAARQQLPASALAPRLHR
jgi:hypothetical protein